MIGSLAAPVEDSVSVPAPIWYFTTASNSVLQDSLPLFWSLKALHECRAHMGKQPHMHTFK